MSQHDDPEDDGPPRPPPFDHRDHVEKLERAQHCLEHVPDREALIGALGRAISIHHDTRGRIAHAQQARRLLGCNEHVQWLRTQNADLDRHLRKVESLLDNYVIKPGPPWILPDCELYPLQQPQPRKSGPKPGEVIDWNDTPENAAVLTSAGYCMLRRGFSQTIVGNVKYSGAEWGLDGSAPWNPKFAAEVVVLATDLPMETSVEHLHMLAIQHYRSLREPQR